MTNEKWKRILVAILIAGAFSVGGYFYGRSSGSADLESALAKYNALVAADNDVMGRLRTSLTGALTESQRLSATGSGLEQSVRTVVVLATGLHNAVSAIARYEKARGSSGPGGGQVSPK